MYRDGEHGVVLFCHRVSLWARPVFVLVLVAKPVISLACPLGQPIFLLSGLLRRDLIVILKRVAFRGHEDLYQSLAMSDSQLTV